MMTRSHGLPPTTHTLEMAQIDDLNERLISHRSDPVTAAAVGLGGAPLLRSAGRLPETAVLVRVSWQGSPEFPDIHGHFISDPGGPLCTLMHTAALDQLGRRLGLRQRWGVGRPTPDRRSTVDH